MKKRYTSFFESSMFDQNSTLYKARAAEEENSKLKKAILYCKKRFSFLFDSDYLDWYVKEGWQIKPKTLVNTDLSDKRSKRILAGVALQFSLMAVEKGKEPLPIIFQSAIQNVPLRLLDDVYKALRLFTPKNQS